MIDQESSYMSGLYDIQKTTFKVSDFLSWYKNGHLVLSPNFQRRSVWHETSKSYLMDTIIRGLPIPILILRDVVSSFDDYEPKREVVDGQQRLTSIIEFVIDKKFVIKKNHNEIFANLKFDDLPNEIKHRILNYELSVQVLPSSITDAQVLEVFSRLNSTGYKLNQQELINAQFDGEFKTTIYSISNDFINYFLDRKLFDLSDITRMKEAELTTDLFAFMINGKITPRKPTVFKKLYEKYDDVFTDGELYKNRYVSIMEKINDVLGLEMKSTIFKKDSMFYHIFALFYENAYGNKHNSKISKQKLLEFSDKMNNDDVPSEIIKAGSRGTNNIDSRNKMFNFLETFIYG